jgi:predicted nucleotidyltransferase
MTIIAKPPLKRRLKRDEILSILRDFKQEHADEFGILEIGIFGSVARDTASAESDLDTCVKTKTPNPYMLVYIKNAIERFLPPTLGEKRSRREPSGGPSQGAPPAVTGLEIMSSRLRKG